MFMSVNLARFLDRCRDSPVMDPRDVLLVTEPEQPYAPALSAWCIGGQLMRN
jgi:hypothetical protein